MSKKENREFRFDSFMKGFAAAAQLSQRAVSNGSFIESVCISASIIDASLRIGLILNHQLKTKTDEILDELLYQADEKKIITERTIYKLALKENIITNNIYQELNVLYNSRNKVVHQYIISDITTEMVLKIAAKYADMIHIVKESIRKLEDEQLRLGVGMTKAGIGMSETVRENANKFMDNIINEKHGNPNLAKNLRFNKKNS
jgi:uncharacterized protein YutE (UPF0331/DUF86 family)